MDGGKKKSQSIVYLNKVVRKKREGGGAHSN